MRNLLDELNESQRVAVECTDGPLMVIAGAGSGKTRVLTYKIAHLIKLGADPFNILALTFTNKAAAEMKERVMNLIGGSEGRNVWMGTFHSIFARILRVEGHCMGYPQNFTIYDSEDSKNLIKNIIKELDLDIKIYQPGYVQHRISSAKNNLMLPSDYIADADIQNYDNVSNKKFIGEIFKYYNARCKKALAMDFDDLLLNTNILLRDFPEVLYKYQQKFRYILVDEYQDTNFAQYLIVKRLAANTENICIVGDDAQSIYGFRGANIQNILNFQKDYNDTKVFKLEQNYRSTKTIVNAANSIIVHNEKQLEKTVWTENDEGEKIILLKASNENEEGNMIANSIFEHKMNNQLANSDFAILYRTNAQSRALEEALRKQNIPYKIFGGLSFYRRKEIKDVLAYFRLSINYYDEDAFYRIINYPSRGIGSTTIERLTSAAGEAGKSIWDIAENPYLYKVNINQGIHTKITDFVTKIKSFNALLQKRDAFNIAHHIVKTSAIIQELSEDKSLEGLGRIDNIEELLNAIKDFTEREPQVNIDTNNIEQGDFRTLEEFMYDISLITENDSIDKNDTNYVSMMTIHMAKGLEFPYVYIAGLEENLFPNFQSITSRADLEEERRLFYVAITRAKNRVVLSHAENRYRWGELHFAEPSRFIEEIDSKYIETPQRKISKQNLLSTEDNFSRGLLKPRTTKPDLSNLKKVSTISSSAPIDQSRIDGIQSGMKVHHERFGNGVVVEIDGAGANKKALVDFEIVGIKQLLLKFARLTIL